MCDLANHGRYQIDEETLAKIQDVFLSGYCDNAQTFAEIHRVYEESGYVMDPHTAVGSHVLHQYALSEPTIYYPLLLRLNLQEMYYAHCK